MILLGFSGKKQSGKDIAVRFLRANARLFWPQCDEIGEPVRAPHMETFYIGGPMKEFAKTFGVPHECVWGNDEQKNRFIHIHWEQLPHYERLRQKVNQHNLRLSELYVDDHITRESFIREKRVHPAGPMTGREFLQQIGEEMFLGMDPDYWVKQFQAAVRDSRAEVGFVADPRKPEQVAAIKELGGIVFRLTRDPYCGQDRHISETALDPENYDWANFDAIVDNASLTVRGTNSLLLNLLHRHNIIASWVWKSLDLRLINWEPN
jgi:hypothetical protein